MHGCASGSLICTNRIYISEVKHLPHKTILFFFKHDSLLPSNSSHCYCFYKQSTAQHQQFAQPKTVTEAVTITFLLSTFHDIY